MVMATFCCSRFFGFLFLVTKACLEEANESGGGCGGDFHASVAMRSKVWLVVVAEEAAGFSTSLWSWKSTKLGRCPTERYAHSGSHPAKAAYMAFSESMSRAEVASSSTATDGRLKSTRPNASLCCSPRLRTADQSTSASKPARATENGEEEDEEEDDDEEAARGLHFSARLPKFTASRMESRSSSCLRAASSTSSPPSSLTALAVLSFVCGYRSWARKVPGVQYGFCGKNIISSLGGLVTDPLPALHSPAMPRSSDDLPVPDSPTTNSRDEDKDGDDDDDDEGATKSRFKLVMSWRERSGVNKHKPRTDTNAVEDDEDGDEAARGAMFNSMTLPRDSFSSFANASPAAEVVDDDTPGDGSSSPPVMDAAASSARRCDADSTEGSRIPTPAASASASSRARMAACARSFAAAALWAVAVVLGRVSRASAPFST
mmetsp:Transcript_86378/g.172838  ORF Transcript_86378/g.172838 Transcript_86378/m.172838 type:complete len:433 (+) Transcript_86378:104-1402(+)